MTERWCLSIGSRERSLETRGRDGGGSDEFTDDDTTVAGWLKGDGCWIYINNLKAAPDSWKRSFCESVGFWVISFTYKSLLLKARHCLFSWPPPSPLRNALDLLHFTHSPRRHGGQWCQKWVPSAVRFHFRVIFLVSRFLFCAEESVAAAPLKSTAVASFRFVLCLLN